MLRKILAVVALAALAAGSLHAQQESPRAASKRFAPTVKTPATKDVVVNVMTLNMYEGADLMQLAIAQNLPEAVRAIYTSVLEGKPEGRVAAMARAISGLKPDLVALQEASLWEKTVGGSLTTPGKATQRLDLLDMLKARLPDYTVVLRIDGLDKELLTDQGWGVHLLRRNAILARTKDLTIGTRRAKVFAAENQVQFQREITLPNGAVVQLNVPFTRGWAAVDITKSGRSFTFATTHLEFDEADGFAKQVAQGKELIKELAASTTLPIVLAGDFNASAAGGPSHATYDTFLKAGYADAWKQFYSGNAAQPANPSTCCHASLGDPNATLAQRVDLVLYLGGFTPSGARLVLDKWTDRAPSSGWPSDHAGVLLALQIPPGRAGKAVARPGNMRR